MNVYSSIKVFHHKDALDALMQGKHIAPLYIRIKPTNICNHHCSYCTYGSGDTNNITSNRNSIDHRDVIPWGKLQEILTDMGRMGVKALTFSGGGEPTTYPNLAEAANLAKQYGIEISLISNGMLLENEIAKEFYESRWVRISFDSPNAAEYASLRGITERDFEKVCKNIESFAKNKKSDCTLGINYVISKANYKRVFEAAEVLKYLGVDNIKFTAVIDNRPHYHDEIKESVIEQIIRAKEKFENENFKIIGNYNYECEDINFKKQTISNCYTCRLVTVIGADQKVYLCHTRAYDRDAILGDLKDQSFKEMWFSKLTVDKLRLLNPNIECNNFCVYEEKNQIIQSYMDVDMNHVNFI